MTNKFTVKSDVARLAFSISLVFLGFGKFVFSVTANIQVSLLHVVVDLSGTHLIYDMHVPFDPIGVLRRMEICVPC